MSGDIERSVVEPHLTGSPTYVPTHPTNTCDLTGNWCEQLLDLDQISLMADHAGFIAGFGFRRYALAETVGLDIVRQAINAAMALLANSGIRLSPYYVVELQRS